ncbi:MAG TPA: cysteine desulfurase, partial [Tepidisphaeraceae bacterium]|nr:cysteine desulfurase [Tepidisphaeraceae bacterium]
RDTVHGKPLVFLDNAATSQKPQSVIDTLDRYYQHQNANIHRGVYTLSQDATEAFEAARKKVANFINAPESREIIFTRGTTESINLVASSLGRSRLKSGDEILITGMEHHSNIVPWQLICEQTGAVLKVIPIDDRGELEMAALPGLLSDRTKIVAVVHLSNSLGTINPVKHITAAAHAAGAVVLIDGAQWVAHGPTDVSDIGCDFYAFSGHKIFGPTGIGALWGRAELLEAMPPYQGGGDMISSVTFAKTTYNAIPHKFEAGTPNIAGAIGLGAALDYVASIGFATFAPYEAELFDFAVKKLEDLPGLRLIGRARHRASVLSFVLEQVHPHDIGTVLDGQGIAIRTGHHCCQPVMDRFDIPATARASLALYNTRHEVDHLVDALREVIDMFS